MKKKMILIFFLLCSSAFGMDTLGPVFQNESRYVPEYRGQKDRYNESQFKYDPEVLVSSSKKRTPVFVAKEEDSVIVEKESEHEPDIIIKTQWCDDKGCGEWSDN